jgi:phenol 2-monooxygenase
MNVSMQDSFNLGWKLASVLLGHALPRLLNTYSEERQAVAKELIDFDHKFSRMFSTRPKGSRTAGDDGVDPAEFQDYFVRQGRFTAGTATRYPPSLIIGESTYQHLAKGFVVGMRFHSAPVIRLADAKPVHLGHTMRADGRWRLFAFADASEPTDASSRLWSLCEFLGRSPESPLRRYTPPGDDIDSSIEFIAICQQAHRELSLAGMPTMLLPRKGRYGLIDYEKIYCPDLKDRQDIFELRGIDRRRGALILVRPDQYVAHVLPLDARAELAAFFHSFMQEAPEMRATRHLEPAV